MRENDEIVKCPQCGSTDVEAVPQFDYVKMCNNDKCSYHVTHPKKYRYQFSTGYHN